MIAIPFSSGIVCMRDDGYHRFEAEGTRFVACSGAC